MSQCIRDLRWKVWNRSSLVWGSSSSCFTYSHSESPCFPPCIVFTYAYPQTHFIKILQSCWTKCTVHYVFRVDWEVINSGKVWKSNTWETSMQMECSPSAVCYFIDAEQVCTYICMWWAWGRGRSQVYTCTCSYPQCSHIFHWDKHPEAGTHPNLWTHTRRGKRDQIQGLDSFMLLFIEMP